MLSLITTADVAAHARDRSGMGASITSGGEAAPRNRTFVRPAARQWPVAAAAGFGSGAVNAGQGQLTCQQPTYQKFAHMTRIATADGGALGSHPARDPV